MSKTTENKFLKRLIATGEDDNSQFIAIGEDSAINSLSFKKHRAFYRVSIDDNEIDNSDVVNVNSTRFIKTKLA